MFNLKKAAIVIVISFFSVVAVGAVWKEFFHYQVFPKRFGIVEDGQIYRSGQLHPALVGKVLKDNNIKLVVDLQYFEDKPAILAESEAVDELKIKQVRFPLNGDGTGDLESYVFAIKQIDMSVKAGEPVLVHCSAGTQRTGGVLAAYRTLLQGKTASFAVTEMKRYDWDPEDDQAVLEYLDANIAALSLRLVEEGVLSEIPDPLPRFTPSPGR